MLSPSCNASTESSFDEEVTTRPPPMFANEIWSNIFSHLPDFNDRVNVSHVCRQFYRIQSTSTGWCKYRFTGVTYNTDGMCCIDSMYCDTKRFLSLLNKFVPLWRDLDRFQFKVLCNHGSKVIHEPVPVDKQLVLDVIDLLSFNLPSSLHTARLITCECSVAAVMPLLFAHRRTLHTLDINLNQRGFNLSLLPPINTYLPNLSTLRLTPIYANSTRHEWLHAIINGLPLKELQLDGYPTAEQIAFCVTNIKDPALFTRLVVKHRGVDLIQFHPKQIWQELQVTMEHRHSEYVRHLRYIEFEYEQLAQLRQNAITWLSMVSASCPNLLKLSLKCRRYNVSETLTDDSIVQIVHDWLNVYGSRPQQEIVKLELPIYSTTFGQLEETMKQSMGMINAQCTLQLGIYSNPPPTSSYPSTFTTHAHIGRHTSIETKQGDKVIFVNVHQRLKLTLISCEQPT